MTFAAILCEGYLDDVQEAAEALRHWHAERILAESAEIEASAPVEFDDEDLDLVRSRPSVRTSARGKCSRGTIGGP